VRADEAGPARDEDIQEPLLSGRLEAVLIALGGCPPPLRHWME